MVTINEEIIFLKKYLENKNWNLCEKQKQNIKLMGKYKSDKVTIEMKLIYEEEIDKKYFDFVITDNKDKSINTFRFYYTKNFKHILELISQYQDKLTSNNFGYPFIKKLTVECDHVMYDIGNSGNFVEIP